MPVTHALTIWQPWAWAVFHGKDVENRGWAPPWWAVGKRIAIHAGRKVDDAEALAAVEEIVGRYPGTLRRGAILGTVVLAGIERDSHSPWFSGPIGWTLGSAVELAEPIPCRGAQGLWRLPPEVAAKLAEVHP